MLVIIAFLEYGVRGFWWILWFLFFAITGFAFLGIVGNKQAIKKQARIVEARKKMAEVESQKAKDQMAKNAEFGGVDMSLDPEAAKAEAEAQKQAQMAAAQPKIEQPTQTSEPAIVLEEPKPTEENKVVLEEPVKKEETPVDNTKPITEEEAKKEEIPAVLVINEDGTSG